MDGEVTRLENPIDAMLWLHKALSAEAARVEEMARNYQPGESVQPIRAAFNFWAAALVYHAQQEDEHMTAPMPDFPPARANEEEHCDLEQLIGNLENYLDDQMRPELAQRVRAAVVALHEEQHVELLTRLEDVMLVLDQEIGRGRCIARTHRHLYKSIVALRVCQDDHFESEEAFVLPEVAQRFSEARQMDIMRALLVDDQAEDQLWILDWLKDNLTPAEQAALDDFAARLKVPARV